MLFQLMGIRFISSAENDLKLKVYAMSCSVQGNIQSTVRCNRLGLIFMNEIVIQTRDKKIPLKAEGRFVEVTYIQLLLNGVLLYETNSDVYTATPQELLELMLEKSSLLIQALERGANEPVSIRHTTY